MSETQATTFAQDRYEQMQYRRSGRSGLRLPAISLGAWETFGGYRGEDVARACLYRAFDLGITHFDIANNYGRPPGNAEKIVGKIVRDMPRDELIISTKAGFYMWPGPYGDGLSKKYLVASLDQSLKRLGLEYVDIFYAHRPDPETPLEETMAALDLIVKQGKALYVGVSNFSGAQFEEAVEITKRLGLSPITIHQPRYNLLGRKPEYDLFDHTQRAGSGVITYSPLDQGMLSTKYLGVDIPKGSRAAEWWGKESNADVISSKKLEQIQRLNKIAQERGQTLSQMALAWNLRHPAVTSVLIGASNVKQIEENVASLQNLAFSDDELKAIDEIAPLFA
ncbi:aldo/keto reductase [Ktedonospora formicarum]|uniref:Glyceraldehyde 3-phosphate reductase n=1 Tax=Ktedonospora formicarum TaxID=2778364 RepID=A0A8J3MQJ0_9CHLR|nr:aldo/keto reductase [Ktedonospora formicarum]GHO42821.1 glyceraldehyde 3-phosphate reductase [Ktedonospora formicarum]